MHSHITRVSSTRLIRARRSPDFTMDLDASLDAVRMNQPDVVFLCSPNNPTGNTISEEEVAAICEAAPGLVILDEAYAEFAGARCGGWSRTREPCFGADLLQGLPDGGGPDRLHGRQGSVIEEVLKVRLPYHLSSLTQAAGLTALSHAS